MTIGFNSFRVNGLSAGAYLASGAVINWNNGDVTLTHSANALTLAGGALLFDGVNIGDGVTSSPPNIYAETLVNIGTATTTKELNILGSRAADDPLAVLTNNGNADFMQGTHTLAPNITGSKHVTGYSVGQAFSSKNAAYLGFFYSSSGSNSNYGTLGLHSADDIIKFFGDNRVAIAGTFSTGGLTPAGSYGVSNVVATGRATAQTATNASVSTYTVGAADGTFEVSGNVNVTASTTHSFSIDVTYTDETNTARTMILPVAALGGAFVSGGLITNVTGAGPYESPTMQIRAKAATAITIRTSAGTFTSVTYNVEGLIKQVA